MSKSSPSWSRKSQKRVFQRIFFIVTEGEETEPRYFRRLQTLLDLEKKSFIKLLCEKGKHSSPNYVLNRMNVLLKDNLFEKDDSAWIVVDRDQWKDSALGKLSHWAKKDPRYHVMLSNPCFEFWIWLHVAPGKAFASSQECIDELQKRLRGYYKTFSFESFSLEDIQKACENARLWKDELLRRQAVYDEKAEASSPDMWLLNPGTNVYVMIDEILNSLR